MSPRRCRCAFLPLRLALRLPGGVIITQRIERANRAVRAARLAYFPSHADEVEMRGVIRLRRKEACQVLVSLFGVHIFRSQPQSPAHPVNVSIDWES